MPYRFLEEIATSDVAFEAAGETVEDLFRSAAEATMNVMVDDLDMIERKTELDIEVENPELDMLLFNFINELIYYKDAKKLLLRVGPVEITEKDGGYRLKTRAYGEVLDAKKHRLKVDVKAVTLHLFGIERKDGGWRTTVVLDV